jgi:hypothetical protein
MSTKQKPDFNQDLSIDRLIDDFEKDPENAERVRQAEARLNSEMFVLWKNRCEDCGNYAPALKRSWHADGNNKRVWCCDDREGCEERQRAQR